MLGPLHQDQAYHRFADVRSLLGVPNFADVVSSIAFVVVGVTGLVILWRGRSAGGRYILQGEWSAYWAFFWAVALAGVGSAYYHLAPDDARLAWDRLPIALAFMCLLAAVMSERLGIASRAGLLTLIAVGAASVLYWSRFDDLRPYVLVQFGSLAAIVILCARFPARYTQGWAIFAIAALYGVAKVCELYDGEIFGLTGGALSGHTLKHLISAAAIGALLCWVAWREPLSAGHD
ncbi:MAG TPA: hypothetical protein VFJ70_17355 [Burkholderiales bacterium]|nr:hypothetical protein [Burkholderiales bacterium]